MELDQNYTSHGELLFLNNLSTIAFWIVVAHYVSTGRRSDVGDQGGLVHRPLALNAIALPFYASSRSDALLTLLGGARDRDAAASACDPGQVHPRGGGAILVLVSTMTNLRRHRTLLPAQRSPAAMVDGLADAFVYSRNLSDPTVAAHIYHAVPERIPFQNGGTIAAFALAPIPRCDLAGEAPRSTSVP